MNRRCRLWLLSGFVVSAVGCALNPPNWRNPGSVTYQQSRATYHDPYGDDDAGPTVEGSRPRDFIDPRSEPVRSAAYRDAFGAF